MSLAIGGETRVTSIAVETLRKTNDAAKAEGQAMNKMLDDAGKAAKTQHNDPDKGGAVNTYA